MHFVYMHLPSPCFSLQEHKVLIHEGHMTTIVLEKARSWPRTAHIDDILDKCGLANLAIASHI